MSNKKIEYKILINRELYFDVKDSDASEVLYLQQEFRNRYLTVEDKKSLIGRLNELGVNTVVNFGCYLYINQL